MVNNWVYLLKMVIFYGYVSHNQMVIPNASAPSPSHHQFYRWYKPFPVMGGKNDIELP